MSNPGDDGDPAVSAAGGAADPATSAPEGTGDPPARAREGTGDPVVSARQEDIEAGFRRPAREPPGLRSLARIRSGGMRLMRGRKSRIWLVLAIAGPGVVAGPKGTPTVYTVNKGQVLQFTQDAPLDGSILQSDKPIGV